MVQSCSRRDGDGAVNEEGSHSCVVHGHVAFPEAGSGSPGTSSLAIGAGDVQGSSSSLSYPQLQLQQSGDIKVVALMQQAALPCSLALEPPPLRLTSPGDSNASGEFCGLEHSRNSSVMSSVCHHKLNGQEWWC